MTAARISRRRALLAALTTGLVAAAVLVGFIVTGDRGTDVLPPPSAREERPTGDPGLDTSERRVSFGSLELGTCVNEDFDSDPASLVSIAVIDCSEPHTGQVFHIANLEGHYPGDEKVDRLSTEACESAFEPWIGTPPQLSELQFLYYGPTRESWPSGHEVWCIVVPPQDVTGTLEDSGL